MSRRFFAAGLHLLISVMIGALAALVVFLIWYPPPYGSIAGGLSLFLLLVSVDVMLGPALTAVAASPGKPRAELRRDLIFIIAVQLAAFSYGIHTIATARPVYLSFEIDRMRVVTAADIEPESLRDAPPGLRKLPWLGPKQIAAVRPTDLDEQLKSIDLGLAGFDLSMIPRNWRTYESQSEAAWRKSRPVSLLTSKYPNLEAQIKEIATDAGQPVVGLRFLPLISRQVSWVALVAAPGARIVGYLPVDGFF